MYFIANFQTSAALDVGVQVLPAPPENANVTYAVATQGELTWDASPTPASNIQSYDVFYKESTVPDYPLTPQITRTDSLASYTETITVTAGVAYDFIVRANATTGQTSTENCASCEVLNSKACGDNIIIAGESCDGTNLGGATCIIFGFDYGTLSCSSTCEFNFSGCGSSGGGGTPDEDTINPVPGTAVSPAYASTSPFTVTYSGASDTGGSGLNYVGLFYKRGTGGWITTGLTSTGASGSFDFVPDPSYPNALYYFDLQAWDNDGNTSAAPSGNGDDSTIYDTQNPTIASITIPGSTNSLPITINYVNAMDVGTAGLDHVELWYKKGETGDWTDSEMTNNNASGSFNFNLADESENYYFDLIAVDRAGNTSTETNETLIPVAYDIDPPNLGGVTVDASVTGGSITLDYIDAIDIGPAGLEHIELWYKKEIGGIWTNTGQIRTTEDGSFDFVPSEISGNYYFAFILEDNFGNRSEEASGEGMTGVVYTAEPIVAVLSNVPAATTGRTSVDITVGGTNIVAYRYKLDSGDYSETRTIDNKITLSDLAFGTHQLDVIGQNNLGQWQSTSSPTSHSWTIIIRPTAVLSNLPAAETELITANVTVGGANVTAYRFKLNQESYGNEIPVSNVISLTNLPLGQHTLNVLAKNSQGIWQLETNATRYTWTIVEPVTEEGEEDEEVTAEEGEPEEPEEEEIPHCENLIQDADETGIDCGGTDCSPCEEEVPPEEEEEEELPHCDNLVQDADELAPDCGGADCPICIDVIFSVLAKPIGRVPNTYQSAGLLNLFSPLTKQLIRSPEISISADGSKQLLVENIPASTYHIGIKSRGYLQKILPNIYLEKDRQEVTLDFTLNDTFRLIGGDVFNDNIINSFDLAMLLYNYRKVDEYLDLSQDGYVNAADLATILRDYQLRGDTP